MSRPASRRVRTGLERLLTDERQRIRGAKVAMLVNQTSLDADLVPSVSRIASANDIELHAVLSPEHGLWGTHQDMEEVRSGRDPVTGLRVHSLYGDGEDSLAPAEELLSAVDALVFDVQDVGARYYTFVYSLLHAMQVAERCGTRIVVCDRPNPLGGTEIEGNLVTPGYESFVGRWPLPNRHGLTVGELARLFARVHPAPLEVVSMEGWRRRQWFDETGLPWTPPSPNMPTLDTALVYPGMGLLEGTNLSEGRGTTRPFEVFGAPWMNALRITEALDEARLPGVRFRPAMFRPMFQKYAGRPCQGAQIHVTDRAALRPVALGLTVLATVIASYPDEFRWREEAYEFVGDRLAIDLLAGGSRWREGLERGVSPADLLAESTAELTDFRRTWEEVALYS